MILSTTTHRYVTERTRRHEFNGDTPATVRSILNRFTSAVGDKPVDRVNRRDVLRWWDGVEVGASSARNQLCCVRAFFKWCLARELVGQDPTRGITPPREPYRLPVTMTVGEVAAIVAAAPDSRGRLIVLLEVQMGLRACEVARAQVGDVDWRERTLLVRGKGAKERTLPIPVEAWTALGDYMRDAPAAAGALIRRYDHPTRPMTAQHVSALVRRWAREAGVKTRPYDGKTGHGLRRTCLSDLIDRGTVPTDVQRTAGHSSLQVLDRYTRKRDGVNLRAALEGRTYRHALAPGV